MKILITGVNGYLGSKLGDYLKKELPEHLIMGCDVQELQKRDYSRLDITNKEEVKNTIKREKPEIIIHTAAVAHGQSSEKTELLEKVNVNGTCNLIDAAKENGSKFVFISSVGALTNSPYGQSKIVGEKFLKKSGLKYLILRPCPIIGVSPNTTTNFTFNKIYHAIKEHKPVEEDSVWKFQPSWVNHIAEIIKLWILEKFEDREPIYPIIPEEKSRFEICNDILKKFSLKAKKVDEPRYEESEILTTESLSRNNLPIYEYKYVLSKIVEELKNGLTLDKK